MPRREHVKTLRLTLLLRPSRRRRQQPRFDRLVDRHPREPFHTVDPPHSKRAEHQRRLPRRRQIRPRTMHTPDLGGQLARCLIAHQPLRSILGSPPLQHHQRIRLLQQLLADSPHVQILIQHFLAAVDHQILPTIPSSAELPRAGTFEYLPDCFHRRTKHRPTEILRALTSLHCPGHTGKRSTRELSSPFSRQARIYLLKLFEHVTARHQRPSTFARADSADQTFLRNARNVSDGCSERDPTKLAGARPRRPHKRVRTDLILMSPKLIYDRLVHQPELAGRVSRPQTLVDIQGSDLRFVIQRGWIEDLSGGILRGHTTHLNRNLAIEAVSLRILERSPKPTIRMSDRGRREDLVHRTMRVYHTLELHPMLQQSLMSWIGQTMRERVPSVLLAHLGGILMLVDVKRAVALRLAMRRVRQRPAARLSLVERHHLRGRQLPGPYRPLRKIQRRL